MSVKENLLRIKAELPPTVTLIAVSKTKSMDLIVEAYNAGQRDFGENYVQELTEKHEHLRKDINWHFIGHLQSNKIKYIAPFVYMVHGVDSFKLLKEINKEGKKNGRIINCLLQLFIAKEETKFGLSFEEAETIIKGEELKQLENISIKGFMAMASNTQNEKQIREEFRSVKKFASNYPSLTVLSYGMSSDMKIAVEEGSTMVRVGSSIFGERDYTK
jgi:pyridoxal phosphate enzyme (YggS family)